MFCYAVLLIGSAMLCYAMFCRALLCFASLCCALLTKSFPLLCFHVEAGPSASPGPAKKCDRFTQLMQRFDPDCNSSQIPRGNAALYTQSQIPPENALFRPLCGGSSAGPQKLNKKNNKNTTENHKENSRDDFLIFLQRKSLMC